jgi:hypothetical protein
MLVKTARRLGSMVSAGMRAGHQSSPIDRPVAIGAIGGSGTRVVVKILRHGGYFMGRNLNESEDAMEFVEFYDRWINRFIRRNEVPLDEEESDRMAREFDQCIGRHRTAIDSPQAPWGWKEPRSIYLLPFFRAKFPRIKFIHVIRDGRDMAFSQNNHQWRKHGAAVLGAQWASAPQPVQMAALWEIANLEVASYGEQMGPDYLLVKYESLCGDPYGTIERILDFVRAPRTGISAAAAEVRPPPTIGRWRTAADDELAKAIEAAAAKALHEFGYR